MPFSLVSVVALVASLAALGLALASPSNQASPSTVPSVVAYQGILGDKQGTPVPDGSPICASKVYEADTLDGKDSTAMVGRILGRLKARGVLREAPRNGVSVCRHHHPRPYAVRKPKDYQAHIPGDLVEEDTMDVRPLPGVVLKHFTARAWSPAGMPWRCIPGPLLLPPKVS